MIKLQIKDSLITSLFGGFLGTIAMDVVNYVSWKTKTSEMTYGHLAGSIMVKGLRTHKKTNFMLGQILHMITGASFGIPVFYILKHTGTKHHLFKGAFSGLLTWGILYDFGQRVRLFSAINHRTSSHYSFLINNIIYGMVTAESIISFTDKSVLKNKESENQMA